MKVHSLESRGVANRNTGQTGKIAQEMQSVFYHNFYSAFVITA